LAWHNVIDEILARRVILPNSHASLIINHSLSNNALIELYAKTNAYNLLYSHIHHDVPRITPNHDTIRDATLNGLRIASMNIYNGSMNDHNIKNCTSLTELNIYHDGCDITTCAPFAKSLRVLYPSCKMRNEGMRLCTSIVKLIACNNSIITTCKPFANSLEELDASRKCGIGDKGLASCHFIKKLSAWDNIKITTCKPFAKTLTNLNAGFNCGITDVGIASCNFIAEFSAVNNPKITTCVPFAKSLKRLTAGMSCGINNNSIASCHSLEYLHALYNPRITTRIRFTNSIKYLYVSYDEPATNAEALLFSRYISS